MKQREPLVRHIFTADPSAHVFNDKIYIYPSHDLEHDGEDNDDGDEYHCFKKAFRRSRRNCQN